MNFCPTYQGYSAIEIRVLGSTELGSQMAELPGAELTSFYSTLGKSQGQNASLQTILLLFCAVCCRSGSPTKTEQNWPDAVAVTNHNHVRCDKATLINALKQIVCCISQCSLQSTFSRTLLL